ncbi:unnamed protein product [Rhizophagus irregularis]|nr:unnamed protein product [Rhizophagus irregularis]
MKLKVLCLSDIDFFLPTVLCKVSYKILTDSAHSIIKHILSGPMGMDASDLDVGEVICEYFFALNKDILTVNNLKRIMQHVNNTFAIVKVNVADAIFTFSNQSDYKISQLLTNMMHYLNKIL